MLIIAIIYRLYCYRLAEFFGWDNDELIGKSIFELHHALDNDALDKSFKCRKYKILILYNYLIN